MEFDKFLNKLNEDFSPSCPNCGIKLDLDDDACPNCGYSEEERDELDDDDTMEQESKFCPQCDDELTYDEETGSYSCPSCDYSEDDEDREDFEDDDEDNY